MTHRPRYVRRNAVVYMALALLVLLGIGTGYAIAATKTKTITVCADKGSGVLHLKNRGRCKRSQTRVTWNQRGPQGIQGPAGQPGAPAVAVWANVTDAGSVASGQGLSVQHVSAGTYAVTITASACSQGSNAPLVTVSDAPPNELASGSFPVAWYGSTGLNQHFMVFTGEVAAGSFAPSDHTFTVMDSCM
jgi:hypothetical protein